MQERPIFHFSPRTHRGVRPDSMLLRSYCWRFQSTHPSWGATTFWFFKAILNLISIHAPIVGCDNSTVTFLFHLKDFNPRTHRGVRPSLSTAKAPKSLFQSTHPSWGATHCQHHYMFLPLYFNPRTHRGVRLNPTIQPQTELFISIHAPIVGCDFKVLINAEPNSISIHAPIVGCDYLASRSS